jgi:hypothetical protein
MAELRSSAFAIPAISAVLGGAVGALLTATLLRDETKSFAVRARPEPLGSAAAVAPAPSPLAERVTALERSLRALALKESVARATAGSTGAATGDGPPPVDVAPIVDNPVFEAAVRDVMERADEERSQEREAQREEWRKRAAEEWIAGLDEKLRLTEAQKSKVTEIANGFWTKLRDIRQGDAVPGTTGKERRARIDALRKAAESELAQVLDRSQLTAYEELDEAARLGALRNRGNRGNRANQPAAP